MPLHLALLALLLGVAADVTALGREWTFSFIDAVGIGVACAGAVVAWRRRTVRLDRALVGYLGLLAVIGVQAFLRDDQAAIVGGASRFVTATLLLFGLSQLALARDEDWSELWQWPLAIAMFGSALAAWVVVPFVGALADPAITTFYDVKNAVVTPLGASNYLAAFLLVAFLVVLVHGVEQRRLWFWAAAATLIGLLATMSRGAIAAAVAVLLGLGLAWRERHAVIRAAAAVGVAGIAFGLVAVIAAGLASSPGDVELASPDLRASPSDQAPDQPPTTRRQPSSVTPSGDDASDPDRPRAGAPDRPDADGPGLSQLDGALSVLAFGGRRQLYGASWQAFLDHPAFGVGVNQLQTYTGRGGHPPHVNAHNLTLHALATTGIFGTVAYLGIWILLVWRLWSLPSSTARTALLAGVVALLLHAQVEALSHTRAIEAFVVVVLVIAGSAPGAVGVRDRRRPSVQAQG
ncbi:MAG TPA: O-antigen ligase family protein [Nitriliruptorales bacterium]